MAHKKRYDHDWFKTLHHSDGWVSTSFGGLIGWEKPESSGSGTRFPFARCINDEDIYTAELYSDWCDSYYEAVALVHVTSDKLDGVEQKVRGAVAGNQALTNWRSVSRFLLRCCNFSAVFSAWGLDNGRNEVWEADGSYGISEQARDLCLFILHNKRKWFLPYLLSLLTDTSDAWPTNGALSFIYDALQRGDLTNADVDVALLDLNQRRTSLPYGSMRLLDMCIEVLMEGPDNKRKEK